MVRKSIVAAEINSAQFGITEREVNGSHPVGNDRRRADTFDIVFAIQEHEAAERRAS